MRRVQDTIKTFGWSDFAYVKPLDNVISLFTLPEETRRKYTRIWVDSDGESEFYIVGERDSTPEEDEAERKMQQGIADGEYKLYLELKRKYEGE